MIHQVTMFQTQDGKLHDSEEAASKHILTNLECKIGPILDRTICSPKERLQVMNGLVGSVETARRLKAILDSML